MKKIISLLCILFCLLSTGCSFTKYEAVQNNFCYSNSESLYIGLSSEDQYYIIDALNGGKWENDLAKSSPDYIFYPKNRTVTYSADDGIFNDADRGLSGMHLKLSEETRTNINNLLGYLEYSF